MKFEKPINSRVHQALLDIIDIQDGLDKDDFRILLWLINAHPPLVSFAQISENLLLILSQRPFETLDKKYFPWIKYIPAWRKILSWINDNHAFLQSHPALSDLFKLSNINKEHPMDGQGMPRHGMYTALWNRHRSGGGNQTATLRDA
jgi:hypothetical protein